MQINRRILKPIVIFHLYSFLLLLREESGDGLADSDIFRICDCSHMTSPGYVRDRLHEITTTSLINLVSERVQVQFNLVFNGLGISSLNLPL